MGDRPLCVNPTCRGRDHGPDCADGECRGCLARPAADGLRLCATHVRWLTRDAHALAALHDELALRLLGGRGGGEPVSGTAAGAPVPDGAVVDMRSMVRRTMISWSLLIAEERGFSLPMRTTIHERPPGFIGPMPLRREPADTMADLATFIVRSATWLAATPYASDVSMELDELRRAAWSVAYPSGARRISPGRCPEPAARPDDLIGPMSPCPGALVGIMRPTDSLLPSELICSADPEHRWTSGEWRALGRRIDPEAVRWRYMTAVEISEHYHLAMGTVWRLASTDGWRRSDDHRRPVLYLIDDITTTMDRRTASAEKASAA